MGEDNRLFTRQFLLICLITFINFMGFNLLMPTLPRYVSDLGATRAMVGWITTLFTISSVLARPFWGRFVDSGNRRRVLIYGSLIFFAVGVLFNIPGGFIAVLIIRFFQGIGWGGLLTSTSTMIADIAPVKRRGEAMGYFGLASNLAMAFGPGLGIALLNNGGYSILFLTSTLLAAAVFLLTFATREPKVEIMKDKKSPLFSTKVIMPAAMIFIVTMSYGFITTYITFLGSERGIANIGLFFTVYAVFIISVRPFAGILSDRVGRNVILIPGFILLSLGLIVLAVTQNTTYLALSAALYGAGYGVVHPTLNALAADLVEPWERGAGMATFSSAFDLGIGFGAIILGNMLEISGFKNTLLLASAAIFLEAVYLGLIVIRQGLLKRST